MTKKLDDELQQTQLNLARLHRGWSKGISVINRVSEELNLLQDHMSKHPLPPGSGESDGLLAEWASYNSQLQGLVAQNDAAEHYLTSGSYFGTGVVRRYSQEDPQVGILLMDQIAELRDTRGERETIYEALKSTNPVVANMFLSAWQSLESPAVDPVRGPAFLMREVISQLLDHWAPKDLVKAKGWWEPHSETTEITRPQRIKFIVEELVGPGTTDLAKDLLDRLNSTYRSLNRAHSREPLNTDQIRPLLFQTQDLLKALLPLIERT